MESESKPATERPWLWKKGQSGNPGGRPKELSWARAEIAKRGPELVRELLAIATGERETEPREQLKAIEIACAYWLGKPSQHVELTGAEGGPMLVAGLDVTKLATEKLQTLQAILGDAPKAIDAGVVTSIDSDRESMQRENK